MPNTTDFIVTDLLKELKKENAKKDEVIQTLHKKMTIIIICSVVILISIMSLFVNVLDKYEDEINRLNLSQYTQACEGEAKDDLIDTNFQ